MDKKALRLFSPVKIAGTEFKNRVCFPSMCLYYAEEDGSFNERLRSFYRERARGGAGMITIPGTPYGKVSRGRPAFNESKYFEGWIEMASILDEYGSKLVLQLHPAAPQAGHGFEIEMPADFSLDQIREVVGYYAQGAANAMKIGLAGVEIHGAHAHEIAQFMSPYYNRRSDHYGGNTVGRARFAVEIVRAIKEQTGADYPLIFRISGSERVPGGREIEETVEIASMLVEAGADAIHVSVGMPESAQYNSAPMDVEEGFNVPSAAAVKKAVDVPVIAVGRIIDPLMAEKILNNQHADIIAIGRGMLAEPAWVEKFASGIEPIRPCIGCNQGCRHPRINDTYCLQNPRTGREDRLNPQLAAKPLQVLVVGAGPAGLEAAMIMAERGHRPLVCEQADLAGGLINIAAVPPLKEPVKNITSYRLERLQQLGVEVKYGIDVDLEAVRTINPDLVVIATGSKPFIPQVKGLEGSSVLTVDQVLSGVAITGKRVAVLGGGLAGCETADYLAEQGCRVTIFEQLDALVPELSKGRLYFLLERLNKNGAKIQLNARVITAELPNLEVEIEGRITVMGEFDTVVVAAGRIPLNNLAAELDGAGYKYIVIGDAGSTNLALDAIHDAYVTALSV